MYHECIRYSQDRLLRKQIPFTAYFEQLPGWDGTDRVSALARRVSDDPVWVNGFHRWMLGLSAQWMQLNPDNNCANSVGGYTKTFGKCSDPVDLLFYVGVDVSDAGIIRWYPLLCSVSIWYPGKSRSVFRKALTCPFILLFIVL